MQKYIDILSDSYTGYARYLYEAITSPSWNNYFYWLIGLSLFIFLFEAIRPWKKEQKPIKRDFWLDVFYMFFNFFLFSLVAYNALSNVVVEAFNDFLRSVFGIENMIAVALDTLPAWSQLLILFILRDFIHWNVHRLLHRVPFLWEFHKVHHSAKELGFATHLRFHWMENIVYRTIEYIPLAMIGFGLKDFFLVHIIALSIGHLAHSNIDISFGPLGYIFNNPRFHWWHHAKALPDKHRYGVNYGLSLTIWDYLFKTAHHPTSAANIELGYPGEEDMPESFWKQAVFPLSRKEKKEEQG